MSWGPNWRTDPYDSMDKTASTEEADRHVIKWEFMRCHPVYLSDWEEHHDPRFPVVAVAPQSVEKYGLRMLQNPADPAAPEFVDQPSVIAAWGRKQVTTERDRIDGWNIGERVLEFVEDAVSAGAFILRIVPHLPLAPQLRELEREVLLRMAELEIDVDHKRLRRDVYPKYLRIIHAKTRTDATLTQIADVFQKDYLFDWDDADVIKFFDKAKAVASLWVGVPWPEEEK